MSLFDTLMGKLMIDRVWYGKEREKERPGKERKRLGVLHTQTHPCTQAHANPYAIQKKK